MLNKFSASVAGALMAFAFSAPAVAAPMLVYVSTKGTDAPGCGTLASPCRQLQAAQDAVAPDGYINILDAGEYALVGLMKPVTVVNESAGAAIVRPDPSFRTAVWVSPGDFKIVRLRGLTVQGYGENTGGIAVVRGKRFELRDCVVRNAQFGVNFGIWASPSVEIIDTTIENHTLAGAWGTVTSLYAKRLRLINNAKAAALLNMNLNYGGAAVFEDSLISNDPGTSRVDGAGIAPEGGSYFAVLRNSIVRGFPIGLHGGSSLVRLTGSTLTNNAVAMQRSPDFKYYESAGDNIIRGNTDDALDALKPGALH